MAKAPKKAAAAETSDDLRRLTADQRRDELIKLKREQFNMRFQRATGQLENTSRIRIVRRAIARLKTVESEVKMKVEA